MLLIIGKYTNVMSPIEFKKEKSIKKTLYGDSAVWTRTKI